MEQQAEPGWDLYRAFLAVLREGSLSAAGRALGLAQPTVGRHVEALERALGLALFTRSGHGLAPTEAALALRPHAETLAASAAALLRAASGHGSGAGGPVRGTVRVTASEIIGAEVLPSILARLHGANPELAIELSLSNRTEDLLRHDADIAVRMVRPVQEALVTRHLGDAEIGLYAHRSYLDRRGAPGDVDELPAHALIGFDTETAFIRRLNVQSVVLHRRMFALRTDSDLAQLAAIRAGFGIGACQAGLARRDPSLVRLLPEAFSVKLEVWLTMHEDLRASPRCRVAYDALAAGLSDYLGEAV